jgi:probable rRNA maturation factor
MTVRVTNAQREAPVSTVRMTRLARRAIRRLGIRVPGRLAITFVASRRLRALNRRFLRRDRPTDVLSFRYDGEPIVGDILIAPAQARAYARRHGLPYAEELARYVVHGLLHWLGHEDRTAAEQRGMRVMEDRLLDTSRAR